MGEENKNGDGTPSGANQPENKQPNSSGASGATGSTGASGPDEKVSVSKSELEKLRKDAALTDNYRGAVIRLNRERGRSLPGSEPEKKPKPKSEEDDDWGDGAGDKEPKGDFVTKQELAQRDEKAAINKACENEELALNWDEVVAFYVPPKDNSYEAKLAAIQKAHKLWRAEKGLNDKPPVDQGKKDTQELGADKGLGKGKEKQPQPEKKHIIPPKTSMDKWY